MEEKAIIGRLEKNPKGLSITELVNLTKLSRSLVRILIARLEGTGKVSMRKVGMAKLYCLNN